MKILNFAFIILTFLTQANCAKTDADAIFKAQICIDKATSTTVDACLSGISGVTSQQAYLLKCSADFIRANITESTLVSALENLNNNNNTTNPAATAMSNLKFGSNTLAAQAVSDCTLTGSSSLMTLASIASVSTAAFVALQRLGLSPTSTPEQIAAALAALNPASLTPTELQAVGTSVISLATAACGTTGTLNNTEVCNSIPAGTDATTVANAFLNNLHNTSNPGH